MPSASPRPCAQPGCPQLVSKGFCPEHATALRPCAEAGCAALVNERYCTKHKRDQDKRWVRAGQSFYRSRTWAGLRRQQLRDQPWCQAPGCNQLATDVDHIVALAIGGHATARSNLQSLCKMHHSQKTAREVWGRK